MGVKEVGNIDFEILDDRVGGNIANKFNVYYVQSINNIISSIKKQPSECPNGRRIIMGGGVDSGRIMANFEIITIEDLEKVIMGLPKKKGTEEGISYEILKMGLSAIKNEFLEIINGSLREGCCPNSWKKSTIIPIPKIDKAKKASQYRPINMLPLYEKVLQGEESN